MDSASQSRPRYTPLFLRVVAVNAILLVVACVGTLFVIAPRRFSFSSIAAKEIVLVLIVLGAVAALNVALLRHVFTPLERMAALARRFDPRQTGQRVPLSSEESEVTDVARAFNDMLERLEHERRATSRRVLDAQEGERLRVAQDLHDQVGQTLTAALLELEHVAGRVPESSRPEVEAAQEIVQAGLEDIRRIARELRPEALDDLGLPSALAALTERFARQARIEIDLRVAPDLPPLSREAELVIYRVAQEALTNVARHSGSTTAELRLEQTGPDRVSLTVADAGRGLPPDATAGGGMQGMAERASIVEAALAVGRRDSSGTEIRLDVPIDEEGLWYPLKTRILLADDHAMVRRGLRMVLDAEPDLEVVDEASDGAEALERLLQGDVDLAILDVTMPRMTGLQAARELRRRGSETKVLVLSMHDNEQYLYEALKAGASGYVLKSAAHKDLVEACRAAMRGEPFLYPGAVTALIKDFLAHAHDGGPDRENPLTPREEEVTKLIAEGNTSKEIAALLVLSEKTVERHRANILEKLGLRDRVDLTRYAIRRGLIDP